MNLKEKFELLEIKNNVNEQEIKILKEKNNDLEKRFDDLLRIVVRLDQKINKKIDLMDNEIIENNKEFDKILDNINEDIFMVKNKIISNKKENIEYIDTKIKNEFTKNMDKIFNKFENNKQEIFPFYNGSAYGNYNNNIFYNINETEITLNRIYVRNDNRTFSQSLNGLYYLSVGKCNMFLIFEYNKLLINFIQTRFKKINKIIINLFEHNNKDFKVYLGGTTFNEMPEFNKINKEKFLNEIINNKIVKIEVNQSLLIQNQELIQYLASINNYKKIEIEVADNYIINTNVYYNDSYLLKLKQNCNKYNIPFESNIGL